MMWVMTRMTIPTSGYTRKIRLVQRAKEAQKAARGWFAPNTWSKGKRKGKLEDSKTKGKEKKMQQGYDRRRGMMTRIPVNQLTNRVRCWRCGQIGYLAKTCQNLSGGGAGASWLLAYEWI
eukprot:4658650-Amphidinium_carterae.4